MGQTCSQEPSLNGTYQGYLEAHSDEIQHVTNEDGKRVPVVLGIKHYPVKNGNEVHLSFALMCDSSIRVFRYMRNYDAFVANSRRLGLLMTRMFWRRDASKVVIEFSDLSKTFKERFTLEKFENGEILYTDNAQSEFNNGVFFSGVDNDNVRFEFDDVHDFPERTVKYWQDLIELDVLQDAGDFKKIIRFFTE